MMYESPYATRRALLDDVTAKNYEEHAGINICIDDFIDLVGLEGEDNAEEIVWQASGCHTAEFRYNRLFGTVQIMVKDREGHLVFSDNPNNSPPPKRCSFCNAPVDADGDYDGID